VTDQIEQNNAPRASGAAHGAMLVYAFLIATSFPVGKAITHQIDPVVVTFLRFLLASGVFWVLLSARQKIVLPDLKDFLRYTAISLAMVIFFVMMFEALKLTTPVKTGAIFTLLPLTSGMIGFAILGIRVSVLQVAALVIGSMGAIWVLFDGSLEALIAFDVGKGEMIFALGVLSFATYAPLIKKLHRGESTLELTFWVLVSGAVSLSVIGAPKIVATDWSGIDYTVYIAVAYLAFFNTAGTFYLAKFASMQLPPAKVMAYTYLTPGLVVAMAAIGNGLPDASVLAGIGVTIVAMILLQKTD
jgi:drug/metabolite transporter (DMT)-like permease